MNDIDGIVPALQQALSKRDYTELTPVQRDVIAPELADADILVSAQTGSGKTVAFGLTLATTLLGGADHFERAKTPLALIVAPTRELALQVKREFEWLYETTGASIVSCVGGMDMRTERRALERGAHIVVGTPGRLRDHIERGSLDISRIKAVVLDEADEMLDMGFREDLEYILGATPSERRTLMFSATVPRSIATLAKRFQRDAVRVQTSAQDKQHLDIDYRALTIAPNDRENAIVNVLRFYEAKNAIVFCGTRATVNHMTSRFANRGFSVVALSGELSQAERTQALQSMRNGRARVCVATDVAARGIDLPNLELVIHADLPKNSESLVHRSGRTGRAGRKGVSVLVVPHNARRRTERLLNMAKIDADWDKPPSADDIRQRDDERLLADPLLIDPIQDDEKSLAVQIAENQSAEQIAAAFVRLYRAGQSAPEELLDNAPQPPARKVKERNDFADGGVWFALSVGRKQSAEPRWLLPMLCRGGHLTKKDIGAIRIDETTSYVELAPDCVERFQAEIGPGRKLEKTISVQRMDGPPNISRPPPRAKPDARSNDRAPSRDRDSYNDREPSTEHAPARSKGKRDHTRKFNKANAKPGRGKPNDGKFGGGKSGDGKPSGSKSGGDKPGAGNHGGGKFAKPKPDGIKPAHAKPAHAKSDHAKPDYAKPARTKPARAKPEGAQPDRAKPARPRLELPKPKPDTAKRKPRHTLKVKKKKMKKRADKA